MVSFILNLFPYIYVCISIVYHTLYVSDAQELHIGSQVPKPNFQQVHFSHMIPIDIPYFETSILVPLDWKKYVIVV